MGQINSIVKSFKLEIRSYLVFQKKAREARKKKKIIVGSGNLKSDEQWFSCDLEVLDITKRKNWIRLLGTTKLQNVFAEHVWEHLTYDQAILANKNCFEFLRSGGKLRIAVPDGYHPSKEYIDYVKPNGNGIGSDDHKILYNYTIMLEALKSVGFLVLLKEFWDEKGEFHFAEWSEDDGKVRRSSRYDSRNIDGKLNYTSLIIDAIKP